MIGGILAVVALVLIVVAMFTMPWYNVHTERTIQDQTMETDMDYHTDHLEVSSSESDETEEIDYDNESIPDDSEVVNTFETTEMMGFGGIVGALLAMIGAFAVAAAKLNQKIGAVLVVIGLVIAMAAPLYLMMQLPGAFDEDEEHSDDKGPHESFFGSKSEEDYEESWGPTTGWYMALVSGILLIVSLVLVALSSPVTMDSEEETLAEEPYEEPAPEQEEENW